MKKLKICFALFILPLLLLQSQEIQKLRQELSYAKPDTAKVWMYRDLAYHYLAFKTDSSLYFADKGYELSKYLNFTAGEIWNLYQKGRAYEEKGKLDSTFHYYQEAMEIAKRHQDALSRAKILNAIGVTHYFSGNFHDALLFYNQGFELSDSLDYPVGMSHALNNIAVIYRLQRRYEQAIEIYDKSLAIKRKENDSIGIVNGLYNKALAFSYLNRHEESLSNFVEARKFLSEENDIGANLANVDIGIGVAHYNLGSIENAKIFLNQGIKLLEENTAENIAAMAYLGAIDVKEGFPSRGFDKIEQAYQLTLSSGRKELLRNILKERALAAEKMGDFQLASESWKFHSSLSDSLNSESSQWAMKEMQAKFELKDKESTIAIQQLRIEKERNEKRLYLIMGLFLFFILLIIILFLSKILKQRKQLKKLIKLKEIALKENDLLLQEMHHRTKNNLQLLSSILSLHSRNIQNPVAQKVLQSSRDSVGALGLLHHQLYQSNDFRKINFQLYIEELCDYFIKAFSLDDRKITLKHACDNIEIDIDKAIPMGLIINEMLTNAIKHAFDSKESGKICVHVKNKQEYIVLEVEDNGIGIHQDNIENQGTGRRLIQIFTNKMNAEFEYKHLKNGTLAQFRIPNLNKVS